MTIPWRRLIEAPPEWREVLDAIVLVVLMGIALFGFQAVYGGYAFLLVGMIGVLLGLLISWSGERLGLNANLQLLLLVMAYFLFGGLLSLGSRGLDGMLPTPSTLEALATVSFQGWKELLTLEPPVGNGLGLYALPYALGLLGGLASLRLVRSTKSMVLPIIPAVALLALGILFGSEVPVAAVLQGAVFGAIVLSWWAWRHLQSRSSQGFLRQQLLMGLATLVVAILLAPIVGPRLPFAQGRRRVVLTQFVVPPLNASDLSSPLAAFRLFTPGSPRSLASVPLFRVRGLRAGSLMQIATMSSYNGLVWGFGSSSGTSANGAFVHFGSTIPETVTGKQLLLQVTLMHPYQAWLPDIGDPTDFHFDGTNANVFASDFLFDPTTLTAADAALSGHSGLLNYSMTAIVPSTPSRSQLMAAGAGQSALNVDVPSSIQTLAETWVQHASSPWQRVLLLAHTLKSRGRFSNGTGSPTLALPGESLGRLESFLAGGPLVGKQIVGDDEQFAATLGLLVNAIGIPARVVLGAQVPKSGLVTGRDVHAWVEVELAGLGWVTVAPSTFLPSAPPIESKLISHPIQLPQTPVAPPLSNTSKPPPVGLPPATTAPHNLPPATPNLLKVLHLPTIVVEFLDYVGIPLLVLLVITAAFGSSKAMLRRRRRRNRDPMSAVAGGWRTLLDTALELRLVTDTGGMTRRQIAEMLPESQTTELAELADRWSFGPQAPTTDGASEFWGRVHRVRRELGRSVSWRRRVRGYFSVVSFRHKKGGLL
jgi:hypothetical protein